MGLFKFFKNGVDKKNVSINLIGERMDRLTNEGKLPYGWHYANRDFTEKIQSEYSYFFNNWIDSRMKSPKEQLSNKKSCIVSLSFFSFGNSKLSKCFLSLKPTTKSLLLP